MNADEIIKALRLCAHDDCDCMICPFCNVAFDCGEQMKLASADLIESLQSQLAESQRREQAAIEDLEFVMRNSGERHVCKYCTHNCIINSRVKPKCDAKWRGEKGAEK